MNKSIFSFFFFFLILISQNEALFCQNKIKVGIDSNYPPYEFLDSEGQPTGFNVELTRSILKDYGYECEFVARKWEEIYTMFKDNKVDILSMLFSTERNEMFNLSIPHNLVTYGIFYNSKNKSLDNNNLYDRKIILVKDDVMHEMLIKQNSSNLIAVSTPEDVLKRIGLEKDAIALLPIVQSLYLINKNKNSHIVLYDSIVFTQKYCYAVGSDEKDLIFMLNEGLAIKKESSVYDSLYEKWFAPLEKKEYSFMKVLEMYFPFIIIFLLIFSIVVFWNFTLKRAVDRRSKELNDELLARERTEMAIIESEERFRTITENSPSAIFIFSKAKLFFVNNAASRITGFSKSELLQMSFFQLIEKEKDESFIKKFADSTVRNSSESTSLEIKVKKKNHTTCWINLTIINSYYKAEPVIIAAAFDITDSHHFMTEISESKRMYSTLVDNLPGMVYRCDNDKEWTMNYVSDGSVNLTGYKPEELVGNSVKSYNDLIHPDDKEYVWESVQDTVLTENAFTMEYRIITKDNEIKWVWEQGRIVKAGEKLSLEGYIIDITDNVNVKKELIKERQNYKTMLQSIGDGVISTDIYGNVTMINRVAEKLTGWNHEQAIGKPLEEVFNIINETSRVKCENPVKKVLETGLIIGLANHTILVSKTGEEYIISDSAAPIRDDKGKITGVILVFSDNTDNKKAEDAIKESESKLKATFNVIPDLIFRNDADGNYTDYHIGSDKKLLIEQKSIIGTNIKDIFDEHTAKRILNTFKYCLESSEPQNIEYSIQTPDGTFYYDAKVVKFNQNEVLSLCRDITQKKQAEEEIKKTQENYKKLFDTANDVIFILKEDKIINCNKKTAETFGYSKEEIIGKTPVFVSPEFQPDGLLSIEKAKTFISRAYSGESLTFEWDHQKKDGGVIKCEISLNKIEFVAENLLQAIVRDITERKLFEEALMESEEKYKTLVEKANDGIAIVQDGIFIFGNNKLCELAGYTLEEFVGKPFLDFVDDSYKEQILVYNKARLQKHEGVPNIYEIIAIHKSGKLLNVELNANYINYNGKPAALVVIRDISERKEAEQNLRLFKATIENSTDAIGMCTPEGVHYYQNPAFDKLFGNLCENNISSVYADESVKNEVFDTIKSGRYFEREIDMLSKDKEQLKIFLRAYPNFDNNGNIISLVGIHTDITQRKNTENALLKSEEKFRMLIDLAADAFFQGDENGNLITVNDQALKLTGYSKEELLHKNLSDLFTNEVLQKKPLSYKSLEEGVVLKIEREIITKSGGYISVEMSSRKMPDGTYQSFFRDITDRKIAEEKLKSSEERYRELFDNTRDGFVMVDANSRIINANSAFCKMLGYSLEELLAFKDFYSITPHEFHEWERNEIWNNRLLKNGYSGIYEKEYIRKDGSVFPIELQAYASYDKDNKIRYLWGLVRDITERKYAEKTLIESEEKYRLIFENITQGFALHEIILDDKGVPVDYKYISVNPAFGSLTGLDINKIPGRTVRDIIPNVEDYWIKQFGEVALTGKQMHYENFASELERYYETWVFSPRRGQFAVVFNDISERKNAEDILKTLLDISQMNDKNIKDITDFALDKTIYHTKSDIAFLAFTNEQMDSITLHSFSKEVFTNSENEINIRELDLIENSIFKEVVENKQIVMINDYSSFAGRKELPSWHIDINNVLVVPVVDSDKVVAIVTLANKKKGFTEKDSHQITLIFDRLWKIIQNKKFNDSIHKLNTELLEKNKEMEQFVYVTSHDLRSPLVNIQGFTKELIGNCNEIKNVLIDESLSFSELKRKINDVYKEEIDESLMYIDSSVKKMDVLLNGLLKLSRMGRVVVNLKKVNMAQVVNDILNSFEFQINKHNIKVYLDELHDCMADEVLINQVFSNLIDNAIKYNDNSNPYIKISSQINGDRVLFIVEDNGPGIPEKFYKKIFEIFQRLNINVSGEGLGLAIVSKIVEKHSGKIWVESEINKGSKFFIDLST